MSDQRDIHKSHCAEVLAWQEGELERIKDLEPDAKYGAVSESIRHSFPEKQVCSIGCGGKDCKYCNPTGPKAKWGPDQMEIKGLFSNWVTENILAISRPTTKAIEEHNIIEQFKEKGVKSIINLQQPGEHESCGFGNEPEGFSYKSKHFMDNDIFFYNFGWKDYGVGSMENILDMVKVMQFALSEGKVAIHCHAGLGRTGVLIAAYLLYANRESTNNVVHYIRSKRKGAVQTRSQIQCIREFEEYLKPLRVIFSSVKKGSASSESIPERDRDFSLKQFMLRQHNYLHGQEMKRLRYIPKVVYVCCQRLLELADRGHRHEFHDRYADIRSTATKAFINENNAPNKSYDDDPGTSLVTSQTLDTSLALHTPPKQQNKQRESYTAMAYTKRNRNKIQQSLNGLDSGVYGGSRDSLQRLGKKKKVPTATLR